MRNGVLLILSVFSLTVFGQSLQVTPAEQHLNGTDSWTEIATEIAVENIGAIMLDVKVSREEVSAVAGSENYFCWEACYLPTTSTSPTALSFAAGELNETSFSVHYKPEGNEGETVIRYCAFDANNPSDSACTLVYYNVGGVSVEENLASSFSEFHPNPTSSSTVLEYQLKPNQQAELFVVDMLGNKVLQLPFAGQEGELVLETAELKAGLYFANILVDGSLEEIKRLIVTE